MKKKNQQSQKASKGSKQHNAQPAPGSSKVTHTKKEVQLSLDVEEEVKKLLQDVSQQQTQASGSSLAVTQLDSRKALKQYTAVFDGLTQHGFTQDQVQLALKSLPPASVSVETALDWLCYHLPQNQLPRRFAASVRAGGGNRAQVRVVTTSTHRNKPTADYDPCPELGGSTESEESEEEAVTEDDEDEPVAPGKGVQHDEQDDAAAAKAWLKQRLAAQAAADSDDETASQVSSASSIDDWELWADPREVERRKQERARAKIPPEVRRRQIAHELSHARDQAAAAKSSRDKAKQNAAGAIIRALKSEMDALGMTESHVAQILAEDAAAAAATTAEATESGTDQHGSADGMWDASTDLFGDETQAGIDKATPSTTQGTSVTSSQVAPEDKGKEVKKDGNAEDWMSNLDLFDDSGISMVDTLRTVANRNKHIEQAEEVLTPWGADSSNDSGSKHNAPAPAPASSKTTDKSQPRALLSQQCQKQGWQQPRYSKLPNIVSTKGDTRYSVTVDMGVARGAAKRHGWGGVRTYQLPETQDGWPTVMEAQNAAATLALYELFGSEQPLHHSLGEPYKSLWLSWETEKEAGAQKDFESLEQQKLEFVKQLLSEQQQQQQQQQHAELGITQQHTQQQVPEDEVVAEEWEAAASEGECCEDEQLPQAQPVGKTLTAQEQALSQALLKSLQDWRSSEQGARMTQQRAKLPMKMVENDILQALDAHDVVLVCGDTGCGKTTQVPQYILESQTLAGQGARVNMVCTQPRRIAAISVADRVAVERGEPAPGTSSPASTIGYHVRLDSAITQHTRLTFCTTGILLRRLAGDSQLAHVSHVIVDEVHERSMQSDFLLALLKELVAKRRAAGLPLKVILMSATLDAETFSKYMGGCPIITAQGRTFPVQALFLEDVYQDTQYRLSHDAPAAHRDYSNARASANAARKQAAGGDRSKQALLSQGWGDEEREAGPLNPLYDPGLYQDYDEVVRRNLARVNEDMIDMDLLEELIMHIDTTQPPGAILVFLPGAGEISSLQQRLQATRQFGRRDGGSWLRILHSGVAPAEQRAAFQVPPEGVRKVVLATNIAETSLTIEDVVYVIDTGRHKERRYDPSRQMSMLVLDWVARANALQRRGRAGRVRPGKCYCLFTRHRFDNLMHAFGSPEIVRVPLEELVLQIHSLKLGRAAHFLERVLQPPPAKSVAAALVLLQQVGALDVSSAQELLTPLGQHLSQLPVHPRLGKLLVLGAVLGCLSPAATIAAALSHKSPFLSPGSPDQKDMAERAQKALADKGTKGIAAGSQSDHLLLVTAFDTWYHALLGTSQDVTQGHTSTDSGSSSQKGKGKKASSNQSTTASGAESARKVAKRLFLNEQVLQDLKDMRVQLAELLLDVGLIPKDVMTRSTQRHSKGSSSSSTTTWVDDMSQPWNRYSNQPYAIKAVLCAALAPNVAVMSDTSSPHSTPDWLTPAGIGKLATTYAALGGDQPSSRPAGSLQQGSRSVNCATEDVVLHPSCVACHVNTSHMSQPFLVYLEKVKTSRTFLRDVTPVAPAALMLFGGPLTVLHAEGIVLVDGWIRVKAAAQTAVIIKGLRQALDQILQQKVQKPGQEVSGPQANVIPTIMQLLKEEERQLS